VKSLFVGHRFLKQAKLAGVPDHFEAIPSRANFLTAVAFSKGVRLIRAENKRTQLCFQQNWLKKSHNHFTHRSHHGEHKCTYVMKEKVVTLNVIKKVLYAGPKHFYKLKPDPARVTTPCGFYFSNQILSGPQPGGKPGNGLTTPKFSKTRLVVGYNKFQPPPVMNKISWNHRTRTTQVETFYTRCIFHNSFWWMTKNEYNVLLSIELVYFTKAVYFSQKSPCILITF